MPPRRDYRSAIGHALTLLSLLWVGQAAASNVPEPKANRFETAVIPALAGDTDVGMKFGAVGQLARFTDGMTPYAWRAQALVLLSVIDAPEGFAYPYREVYGWFDDPHLGSRLLRVTLSASYYRTTNLGYYGIGNDLKVSTPWKAFDPETEDYALARHVYQYDGRIVFAQGTASLKLTDRWSTYAGSKIEYTEIVPYAGTLLDQHRLHGYHSGETLHGLGIATRIIESWGVSYDTRNHETVTTEGQWHELGFRASPALFDTEPYLGATLILRGYWPLLGERLSLGARSVFDVLTRRAPFAELGRFGGLEPRPGPAGAQGVRGVPQGRLHGRTKFIGNIEARTLLVPFTLLGEAATLGASVFFDVGRVWTGALRPTRELDGTGLGLHWGVGAGPRLRYGEALLIRCDIAYAPLGAELGSVPAAYVDVVHVL